MVCHTQPAFPRGKTQEGHSHADRDAQLGYINDCVTGLQRRRQPVISVDCKKKELAGNFRNEGREWRPKGSPERVKVHDFIVKEDGKAIPYGVYDRTRNKATSASTSTTRRRASRCGRSAAGGS